MNTIDPSKLPMQPGAVVLCENNISSGIAVKEQKLLSNPNLWHKIIVQNSDNLKRDFILKTILDDVHPLDLIPVYYSIEGKSASFFARNCKMAIEKLCRQNLYIAQPQVKTRSLKLTIILAYSNTAELVINVQENITTVLMKRYSTSTKTLNLDSFYKDPDLTEFCALSQPKILYFVLHIAKQFHVQHLKLTNNDIQILSQMESMWGMKSLTVLDLRHNAIEKMCELNILKSMHITELLLDGNPVCDHYDEYGYVQAIKEVCPKIEKVDGVLLGQNGFSAFRRNYVCSLDGQSLVDQFLEHYFTLYDSDKRGTLSALYHKDAFFSITCRYLTGHSTTSTANLGNYLSISRNIRLISDLAKSEEFLVIGKNSIIKIICNLPPTEHDPYTFTVDLVYHTESTAVITVTGVFREVTQSLLDNERILGFTRTFILHAQPTGEYHIWNEQLHISNATTAQQQRAFKMVRITKPIHITIEPAKNCREKNEMEKMLKMITTLNIEWSKKCLEECNYDFKRSLSLFVDLHKADKIPQEAFIN